MKTLLLIVGMITGILYNQSVYADQNVFTQEDKPLTEAELAQILAPIALYPDSLLTHILIASTYPIEIVEAHRWREKHSELTGDQITKKLADHDWDASVKALVPFNLVLNRLNENLSWTQQLGDAFLQDEAAVLKSIQSLRNQARIAGNLSDNNNMKVDYDDDNIVIESTQKEVVYVPYYDSRVVYGTWGWHAFPPVYWRPYGTIHISHYQPFYWHSGIHISFNYYFSAFHWHNRRVVVINPRHSYRYKPRRVISHGHYAKSWTHQPKHRRGVAYSNVKVRTKYYGKAVKHYQNPQQLKVKTQQMNKHIVITSHVKNGRKNQVAKVNTSYKQKHYNELPNVKNQEKSRNSSTPKKVTNKSHSSGHNHKSRPQTHHGSTQIKRNKSQKLH